MVLAMNTTVNWKQELKDYREFLQWDEDETTDYAAMTQEQARKALQNDLEFIIGTNGYDELFESERVLMDKLGMEVEE